MKTAKGGKTMNPTDAYSKQLRKNELKRNKAERKKVREKTILKINPESIKEKIQNLQAIKTEVAVAKAINHRKRKIEDSLNLVLKTRKEFHEKGGNPVMFSYLPPPPKPPLIHEYRAEDSVYYHPILNPSGAPPPGKRSLFKSAVNPSIRLKSSVSTETPPQPKADSFVTSLSMPTAPPPPPPPPPVFPCPMIEPSKLKLFSCDSKVSFVKFVASTVVKRPLAQDTPELTAMVPYSVRMRRDFNCGEPKPRFMGSVQNDQLEKQESVENCYEVFMENMKALGAFEN